MQGDGPGLTAEVLPAHPVRWKGRVLVLAVTLASAAIVAWIAVASDISPTGATHADWLAVFILAAVVVWCGASAPWWLLSAGGLVATVLAGASAWAMFGVVALAGGVALRVARWRTALLTQVGIACTLVALLHAKINPFFGASALFAGIVAVALAAGSLQWRTRPVRVMAAGIVGVLVVGVVLASVGFVLGAVHTRTELEDGYQHLDDGLVALRDGRTSVAAIDLRAAADDLEKAQQRLRSFIAQPARLVPVAAQHRAALNALLAGAVSSVREAAAALDKTNLDALQVSSGTIDVQALAALAAPLGSLLDAIEGISKTIDDIDSPWIVAPVRDRLTTASDKLADAINQASAIEAAAKVGPHLLGSTGTRSYLIVFTAPTQARGQSGRPHSWAEVSVDNGHIQQQKVGLIDDLVTAIGSTGVQLVEPAEYFHEYGAYGAGSATTPAAGSYWSNVTMSPDSASVASTMAQLFAGAREGDVDGVIIIDPIGLSSMLRATGPITVPGVVDPITADQLATYLLTGQPPPISIATPGVTTTTPATVAPVAGTAVTPTTLSTAAPTVPPAAPPVGGVGVAIDTSPPTTTTVAGTGSTGTTTPPVDTIDEATRAQVLQAAAGLTLQQFLTGTLPAPRELGSDLGPSATEGHIVAWAKRTDEEQLFRAAGMAGALPAPASRDGLAVVTNNVGGNDIDGYLQRSISYTATYSGGKVTGDVKITLHNDAPSSGLPDSVLGTAAGLPPGTNRTRLTVYTPLNVTAVHIDGKSVTSDNGTEDGWRTAAMLLDLGPGSTHTVELTLSGSIGNGGYQFIWRPQPTVRPDSLTVKVRDGSGDTVAKLTNAALSRLCVLDGRGVTVLR